MHEETVEGWDVHKDFSVAVRLDREGKVLERREVPTRGQDLAEDGRRLAKEKVVVCIEGSTAGKYLQAALRQHGVTVHLGHPAEIARMRDPTRKDDDYDAFLIADLYRMDRFPRLHTPSEEAERLRQLTLLRQTRGEEVTAVKNRLHALLLRQGLAERFERPFSAEGLERLAMVVEGEELPGEIASVLRSDLALLSFLEEQEKELDQQIAVSAGTRADVQLLMTIQGCNLQTAATIAAWVDDIHRFATPKRFAKWLGLGLAKHESAGIERRGHITKAGPSAARWAVGIVAQAARKSEPRAKEFYGRLVGRGKPVGVALSALSRKVAEWIWHILTTKEPFRHEEPRMPKVRPVSEAKQRRAQRRARWPAVGRVTTMERIQAGVRGLTQSATSEGGSGNPVSGLSLGG